MKAIATAVLLVGLVLGLADARASATALLGDWNVTAMEVSGKKNPMPAGLAMVVGYAPGGAFKLTTRMGTKETVQQGTYVVKGDELHMSMDGKTDRLRFALTGNQLTLTKIGVAEILYLVRAPAKP